uniref:Uncharacterized protein n=1 Tax=Anopheles maculatus TaxID=74869 RepID=A0A182SI66_9DIPT
MEALQESPVHRFISLHIPLLHMQPPVQRSASVNMLSAANEDTCVSRYLCAKRSADFVADFLFAFLLVADAVHATVRKCSSIKASYRIEAAGPRNRKRSECFGN